MSSRSTRKRTRTDTDTPDSALEAATPKPEQQQSDPAPVEVEMLGVEEKGGCGEARKRDEEFWYEDGSVIIVAGNAEFRVFKGILADHSPVLKEMFSHAQPPSDSSISGAVPCAVVHLTDTADEVRHLLRICIPRSRAYPYLSTDPTYEEVAMSIRLGQKYGMTELVDHTFAYLKKYYTNDFDTWDKLDSSKSPPKFKPEHAIGVINLALITKKANTIVPIAIVMCCMLGSVVFTGVEYGNGLREQLDPQVQEVCYLAQRKLAAAVISLALRICSPNVSAACTQRPVCVPALSKLAAQQRQDVERFINFHHLKSYEGLFQPLHGAICAPCYAMLRERNLNERRAAWKGLPALLGLVVDGWTDAKGSAPANAPAGVV